MLKKTKISWLEALGLHRKELRAWALYDWANSAFVTTVMASVLPVYYSDVAASTLPEHLRTAYWGYTTGTSLLIAAFLSPVLGAIADFLGSKKRFLAIAMFLGVVACSTLYLVQKGDWFLASIIFIIANIGFCASNVFYESLLPHIVTEDEIDRVSTAGYAMGYIGGGILLAINLAWISAPSFFGFSGAGQAVRISFVSVAVWWFVFSLPLFFNVREPARILFANEHVGANPIKSAFSRLHRTFKDIRRYKQVFIFLIAFWLYNDGIGTIIKMSTIYGKEIGIGSTHLIGALLLVQFLGIPCTFLFAPISKKFGVKKGIIIALMVYAATCVMGYFMKTAWHFWLLACCVALVQGGSQALSRSLFASIIPKDRSSEFFGFYSISDKFAGIFGPLLFGMIAQLTGGSRFSILILVLFFIIGILLLSKVDLKKAKEAV